MSKILSRIGKKKELLERKIGEKKQSRLSPTHIILVASDLIIINHWICDIAEFYQ